MNRLGFLTLLIFSQFIFQSSWSDVSHYKNILVGERAAGMGGSYVAIADDPSGIFYNPAGLAFAPEEAQVMSSNSYTFTQLKMLNVQLNKDFKSRSDNLTPSFFGFIKRWGNIKWGVAFATINDIKYQQNDKLTNLSSLPGEPVTILRRATDRDTTYLLGPSFSYELAKNFTVGFSVFGFARNRDYILDETKVHNPPGTITSLSSLQRTQEAFGIWPKVGIQFMPDSKWSFGVVLSKAFNASGKGASKSIVKNNIDADAKITESVVDWEIPAPFHITVGGAYFFSDRFLFTADVNVYTGDPQFDEYDLQFITNFSGGVEYFLSPTWVLRSGFYTNFSNAPDLNILFSNQPTQIDQYGATLTASWAKRGLSLTFGGGYAFGTGDAQPIGSSSAIVNAELQSITLFFSGSVQL